MLAWLSGRGYLKDSGSNKRAMIPTVGVDGQWYPENKRDQFGSIIKKTCTHDCRIEKRPLIIIHDGKK
jgi:hypothetical protein